MAKVDRLQVESWYQRLDSLRSEVETAIQLPTPDTWVNYEGEGKELLNFLTYGHDVCNVIMLDMDAHEPEDA